MGWEASEHQRVDQGPRGPPHRGGDTIGLGQTTGGLGEPPGMTLRGLLSASPSEIGSKASWPSMDSPWRTARPISPAVAPARDRRRRPLRRRRTPPLAFPASAAACHCHAGRWRTGAPRPQDGAPHRADLSRCRCRRWVLSSRSSFPCPMLVIRGRTPDHRLGVSVQGTRKRKGRSVSSSAHDRQHFPDPSPSTGAYLSPDWAGHA
jgi:hypothetical protein